jgi:Zn-dependent oligopeptidase
MTFREVETLFHEFGHAMQHMMTTVDEGGGLEGGVGATAAQYHP